MKRGFNRADRVADLIQKTLATILIEEYSETFKFITITNVTVTRDLGYAKIYVSLLTEDKDTIHQTLLELNRKAKQLRYQLAQKVELRIMPELKFIYDESAARGFKISSLIDEAIKKEKK